MSNDHPTGVRMAPGKALTEQFETRSEQTIRVAELNYRVLTAVLEKRVTERTAKLQKTNQGLEAFTSSVSHELHAPLRHIKGFVEQLQQDAGAALSENNLDRLRKIQNSVNQMGDLIDDLLA